MSNQIDPHSYGPVVIDALVKVPGIQHTVFFHTIVDHRIFEEVVRKGGGLVMFCPISTLMEYVGVTQVPDIAPALIDRHPYMTSDRAEVHAYPDGITIAQALVDWAKQKTKPKPKLNLTDAGRDALRG